MRAPAKALGQIGLFLPLSASPLRSDTVRQEYCYSPVRMPGLSCLSYENPSSLHIKWNHSGFQGEVQGGVGSISLHLHFRPGISHKLKKRIKFPMQP